MVSFTDEGERFAENTVARLLAAETGVLESWTKEQVEIFMDLMEKYLDSFRKQIENL